MKDIEKHRRESHRELRLAIYTVSTSRYQKHSKGQAFTDDSGDRVQELVSGEGHRVILRRVLDDDSTMIRNALSALRNSDEVDAVILVGGTGLAKRDVTVEAVSPLLEKIVEGFGELFRMKSFERVGTAAYLTRALAGVMNGKLVFCLPGALDAVETALSLILPELPHAVHIAGS